MQQSWTRFCRDKSYSQIKRNLSCQQFRGGKSEVVGAKSVLVAPKYISGITYERFVVTLYKEKFMTDIQQLVPLIPAQSLKHRLRA